MRPLVARLDEKGDEIFRDADSIALEIDMDKEIVKRVFQYAKKYGKDVYAVVSNMSIAVERRDFLQQTSCFVCNQQEMGILFSDDYSEKTPEELKEILALKIRSARIPRMIVTMGSQGAVYADCTGERGVCPGRKVDVKDTTGAGDAFFAGATIGLFLTDGTEPILTTVSAEDGSFSFTGIPYGEYVVREIAAPEGYVMDDTPHAVKVDQNGAVVEIEITNKLIRGSVQLTKVDKDYPDHHLNGAVFEVYRDGKLVGQTEELSDGVYKLDDLPYGDYTLKETEAPKGFFLDEKTYSFSIKEDGKTVVVENEAGKGFANQAQTGGIRIEKTSDDGVLKGFTFRVEGTDITGNAFSKDFVTDEKGQIHIEGLRIGDYVISEVSNKANEKYELPANVTVTVHEGKTVVAKFHNKLKPVTDIPKTGDTTNMPLWAALTGISAIGAGAVAFFTFRKKKEVGKHER